MISIYSTKKADLSKIVEDFIASIPLEKSQRVLVKPNLVSLDGYPYTTSPEIVQLVLEKLEQRGISNIVLADAPSPDQGVIFGKAYSDTATKKDEMNKFHRKFRTVETTEEAREWYNQFSQGIEDYYKAFFQCEQIKTLSYGSIKPQYLFSLEPQPALMKLDINGVFSVSHIDLSTFDIIINLPVLKLHSTCGFTAGIKNFYSILTPFDKLLVHRHRSVCSLLISLYGVLSQWSIYTLLDGRLLPDAQQIAWGSGVIDELSAIIYGDDLYEIDSTAKKLLEDNGLLQIIHDPSFCDFLDRGLTK